jgi:Aspartyl/Asparaginyl beta-hydroxylase
MKYFRRLKAQIDTRPFLDELSADSDAWMAATGRQEKIAVQREALSVPLRGLRKSAIGDRKRRDVHESRWTNTSRQFRVARRFLRSFEAECGGELGRAKLVLLPAGKRVFPHIDRGEYYRVRDRYHLVIKSTAGSWLKAGDESVTMQEGELWWFDNKAMHEAWNHGDAGRIHLIFDMLPARTHGDVPVDQAGGGQFAQ